MARAAYNDTLASIAADGTMKALGNVQVTVRKVSDNSLASIWNDRTSTNAANQMSNPMVTGSSGMVRFFAAPGEYSIEVKDLNAPVRISDDIIPWDAASGAHNPEEFGFAMGDLKISAQDNDHGRWLKCNGRELSQAEIESALSLSTGSANAFINFLGTGSASKYGAAASSKVKLPDARRRALVGAGTSTDTSPTPPAGTTAKAFGANGGVESVTLTTAQTALVGHSHGVTDPGHTHTASQVAHNHTLTDPGHTHGASTAQAGAHTHTIGSNVAQNTAQGGNANRLTDLNWSPPAQNNGATTENGTHTHAVSVDSSTSGITLGSATPAITVVSRTSGVTVNSVAGANASQAHDNMPPYISIGHVFIRV